MKEGETMGEITTIGLDLAKNVFHLSPSLEPTVLTLRESTIP
jgi:hypothetical protein